MTAGSLPESSVTTSTAPMLGRVVILVHDYDEALDFYRSAFGAEVLFDRTTDQRYLHVVLPGQRDDGGRATHAPVGIWFLKAAEADRDLVGRQAGGQPLLVLYVGDCEGALARFSAAGGQVRKPMRRDEGTTYAHVADLYGNEFVIVELDGG